MALGAGVFASGLMQLRVAWNASFMDSLDLGAGGLHLIHGPNEAPAILDRLGVWFVVAALLVALAYVPVIINQGISLDAPGNSAVYNPQTP